MNHCYKSVWNDALGAWVAASEIGATRSKRSSRRTLLAAACLALTGFAGTAQAEVRDGTEGQICSRPVMGSGSWT